MADSNLAEFTAWQSTRTAELLGPDSWLGLIGLHWLEAGENTMGAGKGCDIPLPEGALLSGSLHLGAQCVIWRGTQACQIERPGQVNPDGSVCLNTDAGGAPTIVSCGRHAFFLVEREGRIGVRLRDREWASVKPFAGLAYFPYAPEWCLEGSLLPLATPMALAVPSVTGELKTIRVEHRAVFQVENKAVALLPMQVDEDEVFFVFRDTTSGRESYGGGRFLRAERRPNGRLLLDFNRAYNPPCAFTPFATCPLPPPENWLALAVTAGERKYGASH